MVFDEVTNGIGAEIDVEEGALRALEKDALLLLQLLVQPDDGVGDVRARASGPPRDRPSRLRVKESGCAAERFEDGVVFLDAALELGGEILRAA